MAIDITNINAGRLKQQAQQADQADRRSTERNTENRSSERADRVEISRDAQSLERLQSKISASDGFDQQKVEQITRAISEGRYPIDSERVAAKFLELEQQLNE